jgi:hypothetical protein
MLKLWVVDLVDMGRKRSGLSITIQQMYCAVHWLSFRSDLKLISQSDVLRRGSVEA